MATSKPGVLIYDGRQYAVGLLWFTVQEDSAKILLQQRVQKTKADFYCERQHISQQQGFGWLDSGHKRGMPVAAAMVADQLVGEWHGVFEADNGWWYVQVRSDTITPNGDRFFNTEEEAFNYFQAEMQQHNWPHAYAPAKWRVSDSTAREVTLKTLLDGFTTTKLVGANVTATLGGPAQRNLVLTVLLAAFIAMGGLVAYTLLQTPAPLVVPKPAVPVQLAPKPVLTKGANTATFISPTQMVQQCGRAASQLLTALPGWKIQKFTCANGTATMTWLQAGGTLSNAKENGSKHWPPLVSITYSNNSLVATLKLEPLPTLQPEKLIKQEDALLFLEQYLQPMGALQVKTVIPPAPIPPKRSAFDTSPPPPPPVAPPPYLEIQYVTGFSPERIVGLLKSPGFEILSIDWAIPRGLWQYKFKWTYDKPEPVMPPVPNGMTKPPMGMAGAPATPGAAPAANTPGAVTAQPTGGQAK